MPLQLLLVRCPRRRHVPARQGIPIEVAKVRVLLDLLGPLDGGSEPQLGRALEEPRHDGDAWLVDDVARELESGLQNFLKELKLVLRVSSERQRTNDKLVHHHAERPPIDGTRVPLAEDCLGRKVLRCSHQGVRTRSLLATTHVHKLGVAFKIQQHILWLEIPVHDAARVEVLQSACNGCAVELCLRLCQVSNLSDRVEQVSATKELGQEIHVLAVLESLDELHDARVVALRVDVALHHD
mmetsp:Transcript_52124/g.149421  ORF Transcript_52124/g.149421 Transcript_52124/m.149421 type:complete len:240 (+) Transcript_52124:202-921(+)